MEEINFSMEPNTRNNRRMSHQKWTYSHTRAEAEPGLPDGFRGDVYSKSGGKMKGTFTDG